MQICFWILQTIILLLMINSLIKIWEINKELNGEKDVDKLRKEVMKPFWSKKFKEWF